MSIFTGVGVDTYPYHPLKPSILHKQLVTMKKWQEDILATNIPQTGIFKDEEMESKYYTPSIEEIRVGFDFYMPLLKEDNRGNLSIDNYVLHTWTGEYSMLEHFNVEWDSNKKATISVPSSMRVKYLDREDIESLGWICQMKANSIYFKKGKYRLVHWMDEPIRLVTIIEEYAGGEEAIARKVMVKNKSEFVRLLKQLGI